MFEDEAPIEAVESDHDEDHDDIEVSDETNDQRMILKDQNAEVVFENMVSEWGSVQFPQLSVLLVHLRYLYNVHQTNHWTAKGDSFYGDHLLLQRLYEKVLEEIDSLAEKVVGLGDEANVNLQLQLTQMNKISQQGYGVASTIPRTNELFKNSLMAEECFMDAAMLTYYQLQELGIMTPGLDNFLQGIMDSHESHAYLLKQRCS